MSGIMKAAVLAYLADIGLGSLPIIEGKTAQSATFYVAGIGSQVSARSGELLESGTKKEVGITNFENGDVLPAKSHLFVTHARLVFDSTTANVTPKIAKWADSAPVAWLNGEIVISQDGAGKLLQTAISDLTNVKASTGNDDDFREVVPFMIRPEVNFSLLAKLAGAGGAEAWRIELRGILFTDANKN